MKIERKLKKSIIHSLIGRYSVYVFQLISLMVMARLFTPEQFGTFAILKTIYIFFSLFSEMGFGPALINKKKVKEELRNATFTFCIIMGVFIFLAMVGFGDIIGSFYNYPRYGELIIPIALTVIFNSAMIVPVAALNKERLFLKVAKCEMISELISLFIIVGLLYFNIEPILLLCLKVLAFTIIKFALLYHQSEYTPTGRPRLSSRLGIVKELMGFSIYQFLFNVVNYFSRNLDNLLVGKYLGVSTLGVYEKSYQLMRYPLMLLTFAINPAIQPVLTEIKTDKRKFTELHNKFVSKLLLIGVVIAIFVFAFSKYLVLIILGQGWEDVIVILKILSLTIPVQMALSSSGGFFQAAGRADLLFKCGLFSALTNVVAISYGIYLGNLLSLCWCLVLSFNLNFLQNYYLMVQHLLEGRGARFIRDISQSIFVFLVFLAFSFYSLIMQS
ncbi:lipopolysaccharide biosynthesis protein [Vibrio alginolyticus]|uniref:lipopolysaccharide biosynthesis protein n=1 Tax=Vibrio alginolyticus TaxID=663 RepID=UPI00304C89D2